MNVDTQKKFTEILNNMIDRHLDSVTFTEVITLPLTSELSDFFNKLSPNSIITFGTYRIKSNIKSRNVSSIVVELTFNNKDIKHAYKSLEDAMPREVNKITQVTDLIQKFKITKGSIKPDKIELTYKDNTFVMANNIPKLDLLAYLNYTESSTLNVVKLVLKEINEYMFAYKIISNNMVNMDDYLIDITVYKTALLKDLIPSSNFVDNIMSKNGGILLMNDSFLTNNRHVEFVIQEFIKRHLRIATLGNLKYIGCDKLPISCQDTNIKELSYDVLVVKDNNFDYSNIVGGTQIIIVIQDEDSVFNTLNSINKIDDSFKRDKISTNLIGVFIGDITYDKVNKQPKAISEVLLIDDNIRTSLVKGILTTEDIRRAHREYELSKGLYLKGDVFKTPEQELRDILQCQIDNDVSDVSLSVGQPPLYRTPQGLYPLYTNVKLLPNMLEQIAYYLLHYNVPDENKNIRVEYFEKNKQLNMSYSVSKFGKWRVSLYTQRGSISISLRRILLGEDIMKIEDCHIPQQLVDCMNMKQGLILITGAVNTGKSTTMNALLDYVNHNFKRKIITIEDPVEYCHKGDLCIIDQREIGEDCIDYQSSLKHALRSDLDILEIHEIRDYQALNTMLQASSSGHLVISTVHTKNAQETIQRLINLAPEARRHDLITTLANNLLCIFSQQLIPTTSTSQYGKFALAYEMLLNTDSMSSTIENKPETITNMLYSNQKSGQVPMDMCLFKLYRQGIISKESLFRYCHDKGKIESSIQVYMNGGEGLYTL